MSRFGVASVSESQFNDYQSLCLQILIRVRKSSRMTNGLLLNITNSPEMVEQYAFSKYRIRYGNWRSIMCPILMLKHMHLLQEFQITLIMSSSSENFDGSNTGGPTDPDGGSITLLSPEDYYYFPLNESNLNDTIFFQWENTYPGEIDEHEYSTVMWLGIGVGGKFQTMHGFLRDRMSFIAPMNHF